MMFLVLVVLVAKSDLEVLCMLSVMTVPGCCWIKVNFWSDLLQFLWSQDPPLVILARETGTSARAWEVYKQQCQ